MPSFASGLMLAVLATGPTQDPMPLPAICVTTPAREGATQPRWRQKILPRIEVGIDYAPDLDGRSRMEGPLAVKQSQTAESSSQNLNARAMKRWTIALVWRSRSPASKPSMEQGPSPPDQLCNRYSNISSKRPQNLAEAIDLWSMAAHLHATLTSIGEVHRE